MSGEKKIVGLWRDRAAASDAEPPVETGRVPPAEAIAVLPDAPARGWLDPLPPGDGQDAVVAVPPETAAAPPQGWQYSILPVLLALAGLAWTALVGWTASAGGTRAPTLNELPGLGLTVAGPLGVLLLIWIARLLSGRARIGQFSRAATGLRHQSDLLNRSVAALAAQLESARTAMQDQGQALQQFGLDAAARLHDGSRSLAASADQVAAANASVAQSGEAAMARMDGLLAGLPRVDDVAQRMAENFAHAGRVAHQHGANLEANLALLTDRAAAADAAVLALMQQLGTAFRGMENHVEKMCNTVSLRSDAAAAVQKRALGLIAREQEEIEVRVAQSLGSLQRVTEEARERLASGCEASVGDLEARLAAATELTTSMAAQLTDHAGVAEAMVRGLETAVTDVDQRLGALDDGVRSRSAAIDAALSGIATTVDSFAGRAAHGHDEVAKLVAGAEHLITALDAVARELDDGLPAAFARIERDAASARALVHDLGAPLAANADLAAAVEARLAAMQDQVGDIGRKLEIVNDERVGSLTVLQSALERAEDQLRTLSTESSIQAREGAAAMLATIDEVRAASASAARDARSLIETAVDEASSTLRERAAGALDAALKSEINDQLIAIEGAADRAVSAANGAADKLMRQLITIMDASASVEQRMADAENAIASTDRDTLVKQVVVLTDSLKSTAIDLTKILSAEVSDAAWDAYLKGDRGVFSRRAVKLIDNSESREILRRYHADIDFKRHVNQYIHDFEAILRALMGTRDGQAISVTLLSSDIGKLYVALAQAIDRLRS